LRYGKIHDFEIETVNLDHDTTDRVLLWAGAVLQKLPSAVSHQKGISAEKGGIYISSITRGSPAQKYKLQPTYRIVEIDGKETLTLDDFSKAIQHKQDNSPVRIKTVDLKGKVFVTTLRTDLQYWPTYDMRLEDSEKKDDCVLEPIQNPGEENTSNLIIQQEIEVDQNVETEMYSNSKTSVNMVTDKNWKRIHIN